MVTQSFNSTAMAHSRNWLPGPAVAATRPTLDSAELAPIIAMRHADVRFLLGVIGSLSVSLPLLSSTAAGMSDQSSFWQRGYPALMVTDTAMLRYPHYHLPSDTIERISWDEFARVVDGLHRVVVELAR